MRQFDIVKSLMSESNLEFPCLLILQHAFLDDLKSFIVAPVRTSSKALAVPKLSVELRTSKFNGFAAMHLLGVVEKNAVGETVANAAAFRDDIIRAYDLIISGI
jgi:CcdB protein